MFARPDDGAGMEVFLARQPIFNRDLKREVGFRVGTALRCGREQMDEAASERSEVSVPTLVGRTGTRVLDGITVGAR